MKSVFTSRLLGTAAVLTGALFLVAVVPANAQDYPPPPSFSSEQVDNLVSRIALYPDPLLAQVFAAASYPDQILEAAQWASQYRGLRGDELADAISQANLPFDPAVQSLLPFPTVLEMMARDLDWTRALGEAALADQPALLDAVQRLRRSAEQYGYLRSNQQMRVVDSGQGVEIQPVDPQVIYVPAYDPYVVYAPPRAGFYVGSAIGFETYYPIGAFGAWGWGGGFNWYSHRLIVNRSVWGRTWYNRDAYVHNYGNWDRGNWRNSYANGYANRSSGGGRGFYNSNSGGYRGGQSSGYQNRSYDRGYSGSYRGNQGWSQDQRNGGGYNGYRGSQQPAYQGQQSQRNGASYGGYRGSQQPVYSGQQGAGFQGQGQRNGGVYQSQPAPAYQAPVQRNGGSYGGGYQAPAQRQAPAYIAPQQRYNGGFGGSYRSPAQSQTPSYQSNPRAGYGGGYQAPAYQASPRGSGYQAPAYQASPRGGGYQAPAYQASPRGGGYGGSYQAPVQRQAPVYQASPRGGGYGGGYQAPVQRQAPSYQSSPRGGGFGGSYQAPAQRQAPSYQAPSQPSRGGWQSAPQSQPQQSRSSVSRDNNNSDHGRGRR